MYETGVVYLVGTGPSDPGLITARGLALLEHADVVVYEPSIPAALLERCSKNAVLIPADGRTDDSDSPRHVHEILIQLAEDGKKVVRLHQEDPFLFGKGVEEAKALTRAGIPFEVIPGVSVGLAAPAYAGIPLCIPGESTCFTVLEVSGADPPHDYSALARNEGTLVILTSADRIGEIARNLLDAGLPGETWSVAIERGGLADQRVSEDRLDGAARTAVDRKLQGSIVLVVGEAGRHRWEMNWFEGRPLHGRRILVTRPREQAEDFVAHLEEVGAEVRVVPAIRLAAPAEWGPLDRAIGNLGAYDWVIFTSANGVRFFAERLAALGADSRVFSRESRIVAIGPGTAKALESALRLRADVVPKKFVAEGILEALPKEEMAGRRVLIPRAAEAREILPDTLRAWGAEVDVVSAYQTLPGGGEEVVRLRAELKEGRIDMVTFTSSSTVRHFVDMVGENKIADLMSGVAVASIGPVTSQTARELGLDPEVEARESTVRGLTREIADYFRFHPALDWDDPWSR
ncbi:MAG: uroporphyrinogen-III synthase [bacterium]|nr:uroporphyrinogen-III synthase [bacterium]